LTHVYIHINIIIYTFTYIHTHTYTYIAYSLGILLEEAREVRQTSKETYTYIKRPTKETYIPDTLGILLEDAHEMRQVSKETYTYIKRPTKETQRHVKRDFHIYEETHKKDPYAFKKERAHEVTHSFMCVARPGRGAPHYQNRLSKVNLLLQLLQTTQCTTDDSIYYGRLPQSGIVRGLTLHFAFFITRAA